MVKYQICTQIPIEHILTVKVFNMCEHYFRGDINVIMQTIVCWVHSTNTSSIAGTSLSLKVVSSHLQSEKCH